MWQIGFNGVVLRIVDFFAPKRLKFAILPLPRLKEWDRHSPMTRTVAGRADRIGQRIANLVF